MPRRTGFPLVVGLLVAASALEPSANVARDQQRVFVAVADNRGRPVTGLTVADFKVSIDQPQEVLSVEPATEPLSIVLLTDRLGLEQAYSPFDLGRALQDFVKIIRAKVPGSHFALTTFDGPVVRVVPFSQAGAELDRVLPRLSTTARDSGLREALVDACQTLRASPTKRKAIFTIFAGYKPDMSTARTDLVGEVLRTCDASLWIIEARTTGENSFGNNEREVVVDRGSLWSGGMREIVASAIGVDTIAKQMAELIAAQYLVTYAPGGGTRDSTRKVIVGRRGLKVYAPAWIAQY
jgi:hypothetical protein